MASVFGVTPLLWFSANKMEFVDEHEVNHSQKKLYWRMLPKTKNKLHFLQNLLFYL